jgi:phage terminase large subunit-like protein
MPDADELAFDEDRADYVERFFERLLLHTKGDYARKRFELSAFQSEGIIRPLFGTMRYDAERESWVRAYRIAWLELARKNGKSELLAGIALYLLIGDGEEGAEIYGAARDRDQAAIVWEVAERMVSLSPYLSRRLRIFKQSKRIVDERTNSFYRVIAADAAGNLGFNPHGVVFDEVISQPNADLWDALRTATGTRRQPLMVAATTAGNDGASFAASSHAEMERIEQDPARAPHVFVYMRNTPADADPWDEKNWHHANPALGDFLSMSALRDEALEARNDPSKENVFRQFRLNQWVQQTTRWMPLQTWDACGPDVWPRPDYVYAKLADRKCYAGLDLSSKIDLTSACLVFPVTEPDGAEHLYALWRFWLPESQVPKLDAHLGGKTAAWVKAGWITATPGDVIDYDTLYADLEADAKRFAIVDVSHDPWLAEPVRQELAKRNLTLYPVKQTYGGMSEPMKETMRLVRSTTLRHGRNPVARWHADSIEARADDQENIRPVKPDRNKSGRRIDGMVALIMAVDGWQRRNRKPASVYETRGMTTA